MCYTFIESGIEPCEPALSSAPGLSYRELIRWLQPFREKVMAGTATPAEKKEFHARQAAVIEKILEMPFDELFIASGKLNREIPARAKLSASVPGVPFCGEMVARAPGPCKGGEIYLYTVCRNVRGRDR